MRRPERLMGSKAGEAAMGLYPRWQWYRPSPGEAWRHTPHYIQKSESRYLWGKHNAFKPKDGFWFCWVIEFKNYIMICGRTFFSFFLLRFWDTWFLYKGDHAPPPEMSRGGVRPPPKGWLPIVVYLFIFKINIYIFLL
jgi:hypothetical protein